MEDSQDEDQEKETEFILKNPAEEEAVGIKGRYISILFVYSNIMI